MPYTAILFDLDNTLYDYDTYWRARIAWSLEPVQANYPEMDIAALMEQMIAQRIYVQGFGAFLQQAGVGDAAVQAAALERYRINRYEQLQLSADAQHVLAVLRLRHKLGLITNGPARTQRPKIEQFALAEMMDLLLVSEETGLAKPDPAIFHLALEQLEVAPQQALYVGDSLEHDLLGAHAAGLDFVWMNPGGHSLPPDMPAPRATIRRLAALLDLLTP